MPATVTPGYQAHLNSRSTKLATMVRIRRRVLGALDASTDLGFTTHDKPIVHGGLTYYPEAGITISRIVEEAGSSVDNAELEGIFSSDRITDEDVRAGLYRGAELLIFNIIWSNPALGVHILKSGYFGNFTLRGDGSYEAEFRSKKQILNIDVMPKTESRCSKIFLSEECGLSAVGRRFTLQTVDSIPNPSELVFNGRGETSGYFDYSVLLCTAGANASIRNHVKTHINDSGNAHLYLVEPFPFAVEVNDVFTLEEGDVHNWEACKAKGNALNFGGFPHVAGNRISTQVALS